MDQPQEAAAQETHLDPPDREASDDTKTEQRDGAPLLVQMNEVLVLFGSGLDQFNFCDDPC